MEDRVAQHSNLNFIFFKLRYTIQQTQNGCICIFDMRYTVIPYTIRSKLYSLHNSTHKRILEMKKINPIQLQALN